MSINMFLATFVGGAALLAVATSSGAEDLSTLKSLAEANNRLAHRLHGAFRGEEVKGNTFISTLSISTVLSMLMYGARADTQEELHRYLGFHDVGLSVNQVHSAYKQLIQKLNSANDQYELRLANAILAQKDFPISDKYKEGLESVYQAQVQNVDFRKDNSEVVNSINRWVNQSTGGKIPSLVDQLDTDTVIVLLNAIYFKGTWQKEFDPEKTRSMAFYNHGQRFDQKQVQMMQREDTFLYAHLTGFSAIELPYEGKDVSMVILIPDDLDGLGKLEAALRPSTVSDLRRLMRKTKLTLFLPKFKIEFKHELTRVLQQVGIRKIFGAEADLGGISPSGRLRVTAVNHKAVVEVNEQGSEAAAVTGVEVSITSVVELLHVIADRPFLFTIIDTTTDMMLFQGRITEF